MAADTRSRTPTMMVANNSNSNSVLKLEWELKMENKLLCSTQIELPPSYWNPLWRVHARARQRGNQPNLLSMMLIYKVKMKERMHFLDLLPNYLRGTEWWKAFVERTTLFTWFLQHFHPSVWALVLQWGRWWLTCWRTGAGMRGRHSEQWEETRTRCCCHRRSPGSWSVLTGARGQCRREE